MLTHRQTRSLQRNLLACLLLAGAGAWISGELVKIHAGLWQGSEAPGGVFGALCSATTALGFNCAKEASAWDVIHVPVPLPSRSVGLRVHQMEIPLAFVGLAYFVLLGTWLWLAPLQRVSGGKRIVAMGIVGGGAAISAGCLAAIGLGVAPRCIWCVAVHGINVLLVALLVRVDRRLPGSGEQSAVMLPNAFGFQSRVLLVGFALVAALWVYRLDRIALQARLDGLLPYRALVRQLQKDPAFLVRTFEAQPKINGFTAAAVKDRAELIVFVDYECRSCYCKTRSLVENLAETAGDRLTITYRHYPLDAACNSAVTHDRHPNACAAARAAEAARQLGGDAAFARMHKALFEHRQPLADEAYPALAASIGLDPDAFNEAMVSDAVHERVSADIAIAHDAEVTGTPTMILNGRKVPPLVDTPLFWKAIVARPGLANDGTIACMACKRGCQCGKHPVPQPQDAHDAELASVK